MKEYMEYIKQQLLKMEAFLEDPEDATIDEEAAEAVDNILRATIAYYTREVEDSSDFMGRLITILAVTE